MKIKFKSLKEQLRSNDMEKAWGLDATLIPYVHVLIPSNNDYTLCGQATDEYLFTTLSSSHKVTCRKCREHLVDCKEETL